MIIPTYEVIFFFFAAMLVFSAVWVVFSRNPVRSILFLILCFFCSAVLWLLIQAEFLALVLIFVYVGAVMTLFLFVVMMIDFQGIFKQHQYVRYLPFALLAFVLLLSIIALALISSHLPMMQQGMQHFPVGYNNTRNLGQLLFTQYLYPFEVVGAILLTAIIASISLVFQGRRQNTKGQSLNQQHQAKKSERLRIINMKAEDQ